MPRPAPCPHAVSLAAGSLCNQSSRWPTVSGLSTDTNLLFSVAASGGALTLVNMPAVAWSSVAAFVYSGQFVRAVYSVCVSAADPAGAVSTVPVTVIVAADVPALASVSAVSGLTPNPTTAGGTSVT